MKILIGVDDSPYSERAVQFVKLTRWPEGTKVTVLSAAHVPMASYSLVEVGGYPVYRELQDDQKKAHEELAARVERELRAAGLATEAKVVIGDPREAILRVAEEQGTDLVVLGSHGRAGLPKLVMGSVASHVVTHAKCSVLVVKLEKAERSIDR